MKKKNIYLAILGVLVILLIVLAIFLLKKPKQEVIETSGSYQAEFLSLEQKESFGLPPEAKAQVFYDENEQLVYKIINNDSDIVSDPESYGLKK